MVAKAKKPQVPEEDAFRANLYDFLGALLATPPDRSLLQGIATIEGDDTNLGRAIQALSRLAEVSTPKMLKSEFTTLFIGVGRGELLPYCSYYLTGFLNEKPLAALRKDMARLGMSRAPNVFEPEDNIASLFEMMAGMITGRFGPPTPLDEQKGFFDRHIGPWAVHFFTDLEGAKSSVFYAPVGAVGREFMEIEVEAFRLADGFGRR